jgi:hypothetical protein
MLYFEGILTVKTRTPYVFSVGQIFTYSIVERSDQDVLKGEGVSILAGKTSRKNMMWCSIVVRSRGSQA